MRTGTGPGCQEFCIQVHTESHCIELGFCNCKRKDRDDLMLELQSKEDIYMYIPKYTKATGSSLFPVPSVTSSGFLRSSQMTAALDPFS